MSTFTHTYTHKKIEPVETWESVGVYAGVDYDGLYIVSSLGNVFDVKANSNLIPALNEDGAPVVTLAAGSKQVTYLLDRLVLTAFEGPAPYRLCRVVHRNGVLADCRARNLAWERITSGTPRALTLDALARQQARKDMQALHIAGVMASRRVSGARGYMEAGR